jgi:hypothetical protein
MENTCVTLTLNLLTTTIVAPPSNGSKWQMGFNSAFKGLNPIPLANVCKQFEINPMYVDIKELYVNLPFEEILDLTNNVLRLIMCS